MRTWSYAVGGGGWAPGCSSGNAIGGVKDAGGADSDVDAA
jgi:hypothetical protein